MTSTAGERTPSHPDYRFVLANERTFLAYVRTALALNGGALAVDQLLDVDRPLRVALAVLAAAMGLVVAGVSYLRWRSNDTAIRTDAAIATPVVPIFLSAGMVAISALILAVLIVE